MLTITKEHINLGRFDNGGQRLNEPINPDADVHRFDQEVNAKRFSVCKFDLCMKSEDKHDAAASGPDRRACCLVFGYLSSLEIQTRAPNVAAPHRPFLGCEGGRLGHATVSGRWVPRIFQSVRRIRVSVDTLLQGSRQVRLE